MTPHGFDRSSTLELLAYSEDLPSLPDFFIRIQNVANDPGSGSGELASIIRSDQATTVMILKFANSQAYNPYGISVGELSKAIARIGSRETVHIAMAMSLMYGIILPTGMSNVRHFWAHAFAVALVCERTAQKLDPAEGVCSHELAFMTGLLHDIGRAALGMRVDFSYFERELGHLAGDALIQAEDEFYGVNHAEAGEHLLKLWHLPEEMCVAVANHHHTEASDPLSRLCYQANAFVKKYLPPSFIFEEVASLVNAAIDEHPIDPGLASSQQA